MVPEHTGVVSIPFMTILYTGEFLNSIKNLLRFLEESDFILNFPKNSRKKGPFLALSVTNIPGAFFSPGPGR